MEMRNASVDVTMGRFARGDRESIAARVQALADSLKDTGSLFLLLDWDFAYEVKPVADRVFGSAGCLRNEIIWVTRQARVGGGSVEKHVTILWYVKDPQLAPFAPLTMPRSLETRKRFGDGRIVSAVSLRTGRRAPARVEGESLAAPLNDVWVWDQDRSTWVFELEEMDGRAVAPIASLVPVAVESALQANAEEALYSRLLDLSCAGSKAAIVRIE